MKNNEKNEKKISLLISWNCAFRRGELYIFILYIKNEIIVGRWALYILLGNANFFVSITTM